MTPKTRPPPPAPKTKPPNGNGRQAIKQEKVEFGKIAVGQGERIILAGTGGIGKTSLAWHAPGPVAFFDLDDSLPVLSRQLPELDVRPVKGVNTWDTLLATLDSGGWDEIMTIVIDSLTKAQDLDREWVIANVAHKKGKKIERLEDYGYARGYVHIYDVFLKLLCALDRHVRAGRNVILICHEVTGNVPNPDG